MTDRVDCGNGHSVPAGKSCDLCTPSGVPAPAASATGNRVDCGNGHSVPRGETCPLC